MQPSVGWDPASEEGVPAWVFHLLHGGGAVDYSANARDGVTSEQLAALHSAHRGYLSLAGSTKHGFDAVVADAVRIDELPTKAPVGRASRPGQMRETQERSERTRMVRECALGKGAAVGGGGERRLLGWIKGSTDATRHWCACEWFYGSLDAAFFFGHGLDVELMKRGVKSAPRRLRLLEWRAVRACLHAGKRKRTRLSTSFLLHERKNLKRYRTEMLSPASGLWTREFMRWGSANANQPTHLMGLHPATKLPHKGSIANIISASHLVFSFEKRLLGSVVLPACEVAHSGASHFGDASLTAQGKVDLEHLAEFMRLLDYKATVLQELRSAVDDKSHGAYFLALSNVQILNFKLARSLERFHSKSVSTDPAPHRDSAQVLNAIEQRSNPVVDAFAKSLTSLTWEVNRSQVQNLPDHVARCVISVTEVLLRAASEAQSVADGRRSISSSVAAAERIVSHFDTNLEAHACLRLAASEYDSAAERLYRTNVNLSPT